jgi:hypothetical protein
MLRRRLVVVLLAMLTLAALAIGCSSGNPGPRPRCQVSWFTPGICLLAGRSC